MNTSIKEQSRDTGLAIVLICLLATVFTQNFKFVWAAIVFLVIDMAAPIAFAPLAKIWFGLSKLIGTVMSKVILTILFFTLVTPVGLLRQMIGKDRLLLKKWKQDNTSVFMVRDHCIEAEEIERPF